MPMVPMPISDSMLTTSSVIMGIITFGFCSSVDIKPGTSLGIGIGVGFLLHALGVVPIGLLVVVGFGMIVVIFKSMFGSSSNEQKSELDRIRQTYRVAPEPSPDEVIKRNDLYSDGNPTEVITEKAIAAADEGNKDAQVLVGSAYLAGANGLPQELIKGFRYLLAAANQNHSFAAFVVSGLYADGIGVAQNFDEARKWALKAKNLGEPDADDMLRAIDQKRSSI